MPHAFCRIRYGLLVYDISRVKGYFYVETFPDKALQDFGLHRAHKLCIDLAQFFIPYDPKHRILLLQLPEIPKHDRRITPFRQMNTVIQHRL